MTIRHAATLLLLVVAFGCGRESAVDPVPPADDIPVATTTDSETPAAAVATTGRVLLVDFDALPDGPLPDDEFLILDGDWRVVRDPDGLGKYLELPGEPIREMGLLLGPDMVGAATVSARIHGVAKGRAKPRFGIGLNGDGGYKLRVVPAEKSVELLNGTDVVATAAFNWQSERWTRLTLAMTATEGGWEIKGTVTDADIEVTLIWVDSEKPFGGQASIYASPYASTPLRVDDIRISQPD
jgi:hypothetical protein